MIYFSADQHFDHINIIKHCNRPFSSIGEMNETLINNWNSVVAPRDFVYILGDFTLSDVDVAFTYLNRLHGKKLVMPGSHDRWMRKLRGDGMVSNNVWVLPPLYTLKVEKQTIVLCHYAMRTWDKSHYNSWQLYGNSHGKLPPVGKQWDVGVDNNNFFPISLDMVKKLMDNSEDNFNFVGRKNVDL